MLLKIIYFTLLMTLTNFVFGQVFGPNDPAVGATFGPGTAWNNTANLQTSNNAYTFNNNTGLSRYLRGRNFGFNLLSTDIVQGIELEIEKKGRDYDNVSLLNGWQDGELSSITNFPLSAGSNRMMICYVSIENGNAPVVGSVTYGGQTMNLLSTITFNTGFVAQMSVWYLTEAQLSAITPGSYNVNVNLGAFVANQYFDVVSAAVFDNVDQVNPFLDVETATLNGANPNPWQIPNPINTNIGGVAINGIFTGNNTSPNSVNGGTNCWTINSGFVEGTDVYRSFFGAGSTGGCFQSAHKFGAATGTEQPSTTFNGNSNRRINIAVSLRRAEVLDNSVRLQKGAAVGNDYGQTATYWPLVDTYVTYGGPADLWGTTWSFTEINNANFGAIMRCDIPNGRADVDHYRITVYTMSVLPVELIDFFALSRENEVECSWITASELNSDYFVVQRSSNGIEWTDLDEIDAAGNSQSLLNYTFTDDRPFSKTSYYRLKQVDLNGEFDYSDIRSVNRASRITSVYPNPTQNWANIELEDKQESVQILNSMGQVIDAQSQGWFDSTYRFNIANQPDGVYFILLWDGKEKQVKRFVKQSALTN